MLFRSRASWGRRLPGCGDEGSRVWTTHRARGPEPQHRTPRGIPRSCGRAKPLAGLRNAHNRASLSQDSRHIQVFRSCRRSIGAHRRTAEMTKLANSPTSRAGKPETWSSCAISDRQETHEDLYPNPEEIRQGGKVTQKSRATQMVSGL